MALSSELQQKIGSLIGSHEVVLFMKGSRALPQCGFSARVVQILDGLVPDYQTVDVLADPEIRDGIKEYSSWPTIPQLYYKGELVGGCDIVGDLFASGELQQMFGVEVREVEPPAIQISDQAAARIREYLERNPGRELHLSVDARHQAGLGLGPAQAGEMEVEANGIRVFLDPGSASRANGLSIDVVETATGASFKIDIPDAPAGVKQLTPQELKKMLDAGAALELFDVRTPEERAIAAIEGARLLDQEAAAYIEKLPRDTTLVFHCHHGGRSQQAAEHFRGLGFTDVHNLSGGIDAWALHVDPSVPRY